MHHHGMKRVACDGNGRMFWLGRNFLQNRIASVIDFHLVPPLSAITGWNPMLFRTIVPIAATLALSSCQGHHSTLAPAGPLSANVASLWWAMLIGATVIFIGMMVLLSMVLIGTERLKHISMRRWQIIGGVAFPLPILFGLTFYSFIQGETLIEDRGDPEVLRITADAMMWTWSFTYHLSDGTASSQSTLYIPNNQPVQIDVTSRDVIHGFWVPKLAGKVDAIPGQTNSIIIQADQVGRFGGICAEYCGIGHPTMRFEVEAFDATEFNTMMNELRGR
jgi:cytochrome c oxidase subunit 2